MRRPTALAAPQIQSSLLQDPGFEAGGQGWIGSASAGRAVVTTQPHSGSRSQQISVSAKFARIVYQDVGVTPGTPYNASGWIRTSGVGGPAARIELIWLTALGLPEVPPSGAVLGTVAVGTLGGTGAWTLRAGQFTAPANAGAARFSLKVAIDPDGSGAAWFDDVDLATTAPPPPDTVPPTVDLTAPLPGATISGTVSIAANASDNIGVAGVQFQVDGADTGPEDTAAPYTLIYNTAVLPNGGHTLTARARDLSNSTTVSAPVTVQVQQVQQSFNLVSDPGFENGGQGWSNSAASGRSVVTTQAHSGTRAQQVGVSSKFARVVYQDVAVLGGAPYDGAGWVMTNGVGGTGARVQLQWLNAAGVGEVPPSTNLLGTNVLGVLTGTRGWTQLAGSFTAPANAVVARVSVTVAVDADNSGSAWFDDLTLSSPAAPQQDTVPPLVALTAPGPNAVLIGLVTLSATASDNVAVAGVQFRVDGVDTGSEDTSPPYALLFDTITLPDGDHTFAARARDVWGNVDSAGVTAHVQNGGRPNVVVIMTDDQRSDLMTHMPLTAALLSNEAVQFDRAFVTTPLCSPTRASILTGLYPHNTGVVQNYLPNGGATQFNPTSTIATWLRQAGYRTGLYGKYFNNYALLSPAVPPGWSEFHTFVGNDDDEYYGFTLNDNGVLTTYGTSSQDYSTNVLAQAAVQFIGSTPVNQPLLLLFTPFGPHRPAEPAPPDLGSFSGFPPWRPPSYNETDVSDKPSWVASLPLMTATEMAANDLFHQKQLETLQSVDRAVASLIAGLQQVNRWNNTLLVFTSDNGLMWGEHRLNGKDCPYEECVRVPMWVRAPGVQPRHESRLVAAVDLAPTVAEWAGVTPTTSVNGRSLLSLLTNPGASWRSEILLEELGTSSTARSWQAVRTTEYVYVEYLNGERELYDLQADPDQLTNVVTDPAYAAVLPILQGLLNSLKNS